jgi:TRAP-type uncharacterized transport system fused permease subunit
MFTMITSIILGMGVPTTANYIITSTIAAPAIIMILRQLNPRPARGCHSHRAAGPHVRLLFRHHSGRHAAGSLAAFAGAGIAKANPMKTPYASKLAIAAFLVPYIFVLNPAMLLIDVRFWSRAYSWCSPRWRASYPCLMAYLIHPMLWWERIIFVIGGVLMVMPGTYTDLIGLIVVGAGIAVQISRKRAAAKSVQA